MPSNKEPKKHPYWPNQDLTWECLVLKFHQIIIMFWEKREYMYGQLYVFTSQE